MYSVPKYWLADNYSNNHNDVYVYRFDFYGGVFNILNLKACHIIDVPIQFNMGLFFYVGKIHIAKQLGKKIRSCMGTFARTGNPNDTGEFWKSYSTEHPYVLVIDEQIRLENDPDKKVRHIYRNDTSFFHRLDNTKSL